MLRHAGVAHFVSRVLHDPDAADAGADQQREGTQAVAVVALVY
jgi:hypothetical protein